MEEIANEINVLKSLRNANIVSYYGSDIDNKNRLWVLMDLIEIGSLGDLCDKISLALKEKQLDENQFIAISHGQTFIV